ncbi:MAG: hypothetical protein K2X87_33655 [Gemmataceae bacterium]|nr:hypothetical protein [Gemmataceae bacterium]
MATGSTLTFANAASGTFLPGTVDFKGGLGVIIQAACNVDIKTGPTAAVMFTANGVNFDTSKKVLIDGGRLQVIKFGDAAGVVVWTSKVPIELKDGFFDIDDEVKVVLPAAAGTSAYKQTGGLARWENGATLDVGNGEARFDGGSLYTVAVNKPSQPDMVIVGKMINTGAELVISRDYYNPSGVTGHQFGRLVVIGDVEWHGGTYRPSVDVSTNPDSTKADVWHCTGTFTVNKGKNGANFGPIEQNANGSITSGRTWVVITADKGIVLAPGAATPTFDIPPGMTQSPWTLSSEVGPNPKAWSVKRK